MLAKLNSLLFCNLQLPCHVGRFCEVSKIPRKFFKFSSLLVFNIQEILKTLKTEVLSCCSTGNTAFWLLVSCLDLFLISLCQFALSAIKLLALT